MSGASGGEITPAGSKDLATNDLATNITSARGSVCKAVESLKVAYGSTPTGKNSDEWIEIRAAIKDSAEMFGKKVWPLTNDFVRGIKDFLMEFYGPTAKYEDWIGDIDDAIKAARVRAVVSLSIVDMYRKLSKEFEGQSHPLARLSKKFEQEIEVLTQDMGKLQTRISVNQGHSDSWGSIPVLGDVLEAFFEWQSTARAEEMKLWESMVAKNGVVIGVESIRSGLEPAIENFGNTMMLLAGYFRVMSRELQAMAKQPEETKRRHFRTYHDLAKDISAKVDAFNMIEDAVSVKLECLPDPKTKDELDQAADIWFDELIEESAERKSVLQSVKLAFIGGTAAVKAVKDVPTSWIDAIVDGAGSTQQRKA